MQIFDDILCDAVVAVEFTFNNNNNNNNNTFYSLFFLFRTMYENEPNHMFYSVTSIDEHIFTHVGE